MHKTKYLLLRCLRPLVSGKEDAQFPKQVTIRSHVMHGLEVQTVDGVKFATFASYRKPGWHGLGTVFEEPKTSEEILVAAKLDEWNVHVKEVQL